MSQNCFHALCWLLRFASVNRFSYHLLPSELFSKAHLKKTTLSLLVTSLWEHLLLKSVRWTFGMTEMIMGAIIFCVESWKDLDCFPTFFSLALVPHYTFMSASLFLCDLRYRSEVGHTCMYHLSTSYVWPLFCLRTSRTLSYVMLWMVALRPYLKRWFAQTDWRYM